MSRTMWAGTLYEPPAGPGNSSSTSVAGMSLWPVPDSGVEMGSTSWSEVLEFEYGGADVVSSPTAHRVYEMEWNGRRSSELDIIKRYSHGAFGRGLIYFADPFNYNTNLFPPHWAEPGLIEQGWRNIGPGDPVFPNTPANSYEQPRRSGYWEVEEPLGIAPFDRRRVIPIPVHPDYTLHVGWTGEATGTGFVGVRPINLDGSYGTLVELTPLSATSATRMNATFSGSSYRAVEVFITCEDAGANSVTVTSLMAQLHRTGTSPELNGNFISGHGNTGCLFESPAVPESYSYKGRPDGVKGMAATLIEVGTSARYA